MKLPYNHILPHDRVLFATRSGKIHSFSRQDGSHVSTWEHPDVKKQVEALASAAAAEAEDAPEPEDGPPAKRQRLTEDGQEAPLPAGEEAMDVDEPIAEEDQANADSSKDQKQQKRKDKTQGRPNYGKIPDQPIITELAITSNGNYLIAISGQDKSIWTFEHDGNGVLTELSQRPMPKRPNAVLISPDDKTILSADKFGDVYSLPLIPSPSDATAGDAAAHSAAPAAAASSQKAYKPEATNLTVHSQRNIHALTQQRLWAAKQKEENAKGQSEKPTFEHTLVIGHVSLLTSMCLAQKDGRRYIITADRDEHIRISRYMPQAHVIEGFCLGHRNFVSGLTIPPRRPDLLVSGGGDDELFVWDWERNTLLSKVNLLEHANFVNNAVTKVAVSHLSSVTVLVGDTEATLVIVICEGIPAVFAFRLTDESTLVHVQTLVMLGVPLHVAHLSREDGTLKEIVVAVDTNNVEIATVGLDFFVWDQGNGNFKLDRGFQIQDAQLEASEPEVPDQVVRTLLYNAEDLRKQSHERDGEQPGEEKGQQVGESPAEAEVGVGAEDA